VCAAAQLPLYIGDSCGEAAPGQAFRFALCTCSDLVASEALQIDAFDGALSRPVARAAVGINGAAQLDRGGNVQGSVYVAGRFSQGQSLRVSGELITPAPPPCACAPEQLLDIAELVRARRDDNDDDASALEPGELAGFTGARELTLRCGRYFLTRISGSGPLTIHGQGNVLLFVEGNVELDDALNVDASAGAEVALVVAGDMRVTGATSLGGDPSAGGRVSLILASEGSLNLAGSTRVVGDIYAPRADLVTAGMFEQYGSLFVHRAAPGGGFALHQNVAAAERSTCAP
jgi:hypothetical protein